VGGANFRESRRIPPKDDSKVIFFSSVAHFWVPGAKTTGPIVKKFGFS
jgi:hypothetical protein